MIAFILDNLATIVIGAILLGIVALIIVKLIKDRKKGSACSCGCSGCPSSSICHSKNKTN